MKLNMFNSWKPLGKLYARDIEYQTTRSTKGGKTFSTTLRDAKTGNAILRTFGSSPESSMSNAQRALKSVGSDAVYQAIETGNPISYNVQVADDTRRANDNVDWRDGINHRHRAQKRIVGENIEVIEEDDEDQFIMVDGKKVKKTKKPLFRNFVAKHARTFNKAVVMADRKNDYKRRPKHRNKNFENA